MHRLAVLSEDLSAVEMYPATEAEVRGVYPELTLGSELRDDSLTEWPRVVLVHDAEEPVTVWGERAVEVPDPVNDAGTWRQAWTVETITLTEAKQQLGQMAIEIYWSRMLQAPDIPEFQAAGLSFIATIQARQARWDDDLANVAQRIQDATAIHGTGGAYDIYLELQALA